MYSSLYHVLSHRQIEEAEIGNEVEEEFVEVGR
jgi:hypothetical protein